MALADAAGRLGARAALARYVSASWLESQARLERAKWHPLYVWLEAEDRGGDADRFIDALDASLAAASGEVRSRGRRLKGDESDYWSAICELYVAATLARAGLPASLGNPDIVVADGTGSLAIELNAVQETGNTARLTRLLAAAWDGELQAVLEVPDERVHVTRSEAEAVVALMRAAERAHRVTTRR